MFETVFKVKVVDAINPSKVIAEELHLPSIPRVGDLVIVREDDTYVKGYQAGPSFFHADERLNDFGRWYPTVMITGRFVERRYQPITEEDAQTRQIDEQEAK